MGVDAIHQFVPIVIPGDAVSGQVFRWQDVLQESGLHSEILVEHVHPDLPSAFRSRVHRLEGDGSALLADGALVIHYAISTPALPRLLESSSRKALCYHNITPGDMLRDYNPDMAAHCDRGRADLMRLQGRVDVLLAPSRFSATELGDAGFGEVKVVPYIIDQPAEPPPLTRPTPPMILYVGRIAPNKRIEDVVKVFTLYQRHREPHASLVLLGPEEGFESYHRALDQLVRDLGTRNVEWTGRISTPRWRDAYYERAAAYLSMSVHEGFGIPLIEALAHNVPVVARRAAAVPETLGGAGVVLDNSDLAVFAEALHDVVTSDVTRRQIAAAALERLRELSPDRVAPMLRDALAPLVEA